MKKFTVKFFHSFNDLNDVVMYAVDAKSFSDALKIARGRRKADGIDGRKYQKWHVSLL